MGVSLLQVSLLRFVSQVSQGQGDLLRSTAWSPLPLGFPEPRAGGFLGFGLFIERKLFGDVGISNLSQMIEERERVKGGHTRRAERPEGTQHLGYKATVLSNQPQGKPDLAQSSFLCATPWEVTLASWSLLVLKIISTLVWKTHFQVFKSLAQFKT